MKVISNESYCCINGNVILSQHLHAFIFIQSSPGYFFQVSDVFISLKNLLAQIRNDLFKIQLINQCFHMFSYVQHESYKTHEHVSA